MDFGVTMQRTAIALLTTLWGVLTPVTLAAAPAEAPSALVMLTLRFKDAGTGVPLPVRACVFSGINVIPPAIPETYLYQDGYHGEFFYCDGNAVLAVPIGSVTIRAGHGFEYQPLEATVTVTRPTTLTLELTRLFDMASLGWYSGDTHVHITHQPVVYDLDADDLSLVAQAEDLNFVNSMEEQILFTGTIDPLSTPNRVLFFSKEQRNAHFSHLTILGLKQWIYDQGCVEQGIACGRTLDALIYDQVHAQPGEVAVIAAHPFVTFDEFDVDGWPGVGMWRGMPIDLPAGALDAMDLLSFWNAPPPAGIDPYFRVLDAGFRIPPAAGTDCTLSTGISGPAGAYRMYVRTGIAFTMDSWIAGLKAGHSFVTNYPLFEQFEIEGAEPGDVLTHDGPTLDGAVSVVCAAEFQRVEIWGDTGLLAVFMPPNGAKVFSTSFSVARPGLTWIVARVTGYSQEWHMIPVGGQLFAQTAPIYLESSTSQSQGTRAAAAQYFLDRLDETEAVYNAIGYFPDNTRPAFDAAVAFARAYFDSLMTTPTGVEAPPLRARWSLRNAWPNPSAGGVTIDYAAPADGGEHTVTVYDAAGRAVSVLFSGSRPEGDHRVTWDGRDALGRQVASGVYFVRLRSRDAAIVSRKLVLLR
jgi:hypothetical protein